MHTNLVLNRLLQSLLLLPVAVYASVVLAECPAVGADLEFLFLADDVPALQAVEQDGVFCSQTVALRFGYTVRRREGGHESHRI